MLVSMGPTTAAAPLTASRKRCAKGDAAMPLMIVLLTGPFSSVVAILLTTLVPMLSAKSRCKTTGFPVSSLQP